MNGTELLLTAGAFAIGALIFIGLVARWATK
jgi:hypothetical protein